MKKLNLEVQYITETSYEDGTYWINYEIDGKDSIEIIHGTDKEDAIDNFLALGVDELKNKIDINTVSSQLRELVELCYDSDNDMWFVEEGEEGDYNIDALEKEVDDLELNEFITFYEDAVTPITLYGGVICKFTY